MPYVTQETRKRVDPEIDYLIKKVKYWQEEGRNGLANYIIYKFICGVYPPTSYDSVSDGVKTFECAKQEYIRRKLEPYEDAKRDENGDIL